MSMVASDEHPFFLFDWYHGFMFFREEVAREAFMRAHSRAWRGNVVMGVATHAGFGVDDGPTDVRCLGA